jgi:DNA-3-methyladenine glycosylase
MKRLTADFFQQEALTLAPQLLGKKLVRVINGKRFEYRITEVEAYIGGEDLACHASKGRTPRTEVMFRQGGVVYVYLIYGMYWMLNIVSGNENHPQAVLIRAITGYNGPGKLGKALQLDKSFYGEDLCTSSRLWIENAPAVEYTTTPRIGIQYAPLEWQEKPWRFIMK